MVASFRNFAFCGKKQEAKEAEEAEEGKEEELGEAIAACSKATAPIASRRLIINQYRPRGCHDD
jgi:hypothetical protein